MANGHGGARIGAGQKKKPLAEKLQNGNPGHRPLEAITFEAADLPSETMPPPKEYMVARQKDGKDTVAVDVYENTWKWLQERGCSHLIPAQVLEHYAQTVARWVQCEEAITTFGFLGKHPTTGAPIPSPFVSMSQGFMKQANNLWLIIFQTVKENCSTPFDGTNPQDDVMERLLRTRRG
ncbi:MAG: P27 family phage terminase small subunit [Firmicutes bacterium]|nr:P27 family phage terminase small subunit [Bacillota bacterium]